MWISNEHDVYLCIKRGNMKLDNERKDYVYKYDVECDDTEQQVLCKYAIEKFATDIPAQLEYAIVKMLEDFVMRNKEGEKLPEVLAKNVNKKSKTRKASKKG